jgi:hypothetical protein
VPLIPRQHRSTLILGIVLALIGLWVWGKIDMARQRQAELEAVEQFEQQRVAEIVRRRDADSKDPLAEVKRKLDAGEDRETVKAWAEQQQREVQAEAQREIEGK